MLVAQRYFVIESFLEIGGLERFNTHTHLFFHRVAEARRSVDERREHTHTQRSCSYSDEVPMELRSDFWAKV